MVFIGIGSFLGYCKVNLKQWAPFVSYPSPNFFCKAITDLSSLPECSFGLCKTYTDTCHYGEKKGKIIILCTSLNICCF